MALSGPKEIKSSLAVGNLPAHCHPQYHPLAKSPGSATLAMAIWRFKLPSPTALFIAGREQLHALLCRVCKGPRCLGILGGGALDEEGLCTEARGDSGVGDRGSLCARAGAAGEEVGGGAREVLTTCARGRFWATRVKLDGRCLMISLPSSEPVIGVALPSVDEREHLVLRQNNMVTVTALRAQSAGVWGSACVDTMAMGTSEAAIGASEAATGSGFVGVVAAAVETELGLEFCTCVNQRAESTCWDVHAEVVGFLDVGSKGEEIGKLGGKEESCLTMLWQYQQTILSSSRAH
ncbi:hypothetical protein GGX14DRAFT_390917 [Mycena pura]|uniref:Uncharacterized protein n=1 Tax=Mycena pura TaxID=153505 RepID=A0AAD6YIT6_9AGAR|nr:hypothetical protein GGX14DRAFT_390917 [Mycena pura]